MAEILVQAVGDDVYEVSVNEGHSSSSHRVTAPTEDVTRLGGGVTGEALVEASFRFLLDREPKESILGGFGLDSIPRYFPEYEATIGDYL